MARLRFWLILAALAAALAGGLWYWQQAPLRAAPAPAPDAAKNGAGADARPVAVEVAVVTVDTVVEELQAVGSLQPDEAVSVAPEIAGRIERIAFREGESVKAGEVLVQLDASILEAELARARSDLALAKANLERAVTLAGQGMGTLRARDEAQGAHQAAQANLQLAEARLAKATLRAPLSGRVGLRAVSAGAYVAPGQRIVDLTSVHPLKLDFRVPELALTHLRAGMAVSLTVDALAGRRFEGEIIAIDPVVEAAGRSLQLRARVPNPKAELAPGLFARVQVVVARRENALLVPESAVFAREAKPHVYRVEGDRARRVPVELGQRRPGFVEVRAGLAPGAVVVTAGQQQLREGARVRLVQPAARGG